jgi:hypothetical protein
MTYKNRDAIRPIKLPTNSGISTSDATSTWATTGNDAYGQPLVPLQMTTYPPLTPLDSEGTDYRTLAPDSVLRTFAFELYGRDLVVPTVQGRVARKPAGNPPYNLVQCNLAGGYAVRWNSTFLTLENANSVIWTDQKQEPHSCWKVVPGYCGDEKYIMLRSLANNMFLTVDASSDALVCKDIPTARTAKQYCWKLVPEAPVAKKCGCEYDYSKGRVVCIPCDIKKLPNGTESCETVTAGYRAECCLETGSKRNDPWCRTAVWPEVVGRSLREVMLYIRTRRPDLVLQPCANECTTAAFPEPKPSVVIIPYDARSGIVTAPARRLI